MKRKPVKRSTSGQNASTRIRRVVGELRRLGYTVTPPKPEGEYTKAMRTGVKPEIWPPIVMSRAELDHFRKLCEMGWDAVEAKPELSAEIAAMDELDAIAGMENP